MNIIVTNEQYFGVKQLVDAEIQRLERVITERAEAEKSTAVFGRSLGFYKRLKTKLVEQSPKS